MRLTSYAFLFLLPVFLLGVVACDDDDDDLTGPAGPFDLAFTGDASFQEAHADDEIHVVLEGSDGEVLASEAATVSATEDPVFSFTFPGVLEEGEDYVLKYWIDSNFDGGTAGVCDPPENDHQWRIEIDAVADDEMVTETHRPGDTEAVCDAFAFDLEFTGDATFQEPHGEQTINVAVVRSADGGQTIATETGTVSASEDPSFSFSFPGLLSRGMEYELHYWIDSNFDGGTAGVCDPPENDHQWRIEIGPVDDGVTQNDTHRPEETESVCSTFE